MVAGVGRGSAKSQSARRGKTSHDSPVGIRPIAAAIVKGDVRLGCAAFAASLRRARTAAATMQPRGRVRSTANAQRTVGNEIPRRALRDKIRRIEKAIDFYRAAPDRKGVE